VSNNIIYHRNTGFTIRPSGAFFAQALPICAGSWVYWSRFFEQSEIKELYESGTPHDRKVEIVKLAIDRALNNAPCYTGDIRDQMIPGKY